MTPPNRSLNADVTHVWTAPTCGSPVSSIPFRLSRNQTTPEVERVDKMDSLHSRFTTMASDFLANTQGITS